MDRRRLAERDHRKSAPADRPQRPRPSSPDGGGSSLGFTTSWLTGAALSPALALRTRSGGPPAPSRAPPRGAAGAAGARRRRWSSRFISKSISLHPHRSVAVDARVSQSVKPGLRAFRRRHADSPPRREFDVVLIHDAIMYLTTPADVVAALETAALPLSVAGTVVVIPDSVRETSNRGRTPVGRTATKPGTSLPRVAVGTRSDGRCVRWSTTHSSCESPWPE